MGIHLTLCWTDRVCCDVVLGLDGQEDWRSSSYVVLPAVDHCFSFPKRYSSFRSGTVKGFSFVRSVHYLFLVVLFVCLLFYVSTYLRECWVLVEYVLIVPLCFSRRSLVLFSFFILIHIIFAIKKNHVKSMVCSLVSVCVQFVIVHVACISGTCNKSMNFC
jgi:hypothetical protein